MKLAQILQSDNIADDLSDKELAVIAAQVKEHYDTDIASRSDWTDAYIKWLDMTGQKIEVKTTPWPGAANIKYPLMTQAALNFNARALPALLPNNEPVGAGVVGPDEDGAKRQVADKVAKHMNYQVTTEMVEWEEELDSLLMALPVSGMEFRKIYFDGAEGRNVARHVTPANLVVNYYAKDLGTVRKTEIHKWNKNYIVERIADRTFADVDWETHPDPKTGNASEIEEENAARSGQEIPTTQDSATPFTVLEYHGWYDLDEDGYEEPYIITMVEDSLQILQIIPRFDQTTATLTEDGRVVRIVAYESYVKYGLIPNPDGSFYDIGFGNLLFPINAVVNTAINMMLDAGASSIMNSGFLGRGIKMRGGMFTMAPNTWLTVNSSGDDIRKSFVPMPTKEPSNVLFSLMSFMVDAGQKLSSTTDIFTGEMPGQNTKTGVTQAVRDEGQKVFTAIYKRIRRSVKKELDLLYELNGIVLSAGEQGANTLIARSAQVFQVNADMYKKELMNIQPSADPNIAIKEQQMQKDLTVYQMVSESGIGDKAVAQKRVLRTMEVENLEEVQPEGSAPPPDPKAQMEQQSQQMEASQADFNAEMEQKRFQLEVFEVENKLKIEMAKVLATTNKDANEFGIKVAELEFKDKEAIEGRQHERTEREANSGSMGSMES